MYNSYSSFLLYLYDSSLISNFGRPVLITDVVPKWKAFNWTADFFRNHYGKERVSMKAVEV